MRNILNKCFKLFVNILIGILFIFISFVLFYICELTVSKLKNDKPLLKIYTIVSQSMEPKISVYDMVVVSKIYNENALNKGDIITFYSKYLLDGKYSITHRIEKVIIKDGKKYYKTKGDNNVNPDEGLLTLDDIEGKVVYVIPKLGVIQSFILSKLGWFTVIFIPSIGMIIYDIFMIFKIKNNKNNNI